MVTHCSGSRMTSCVVAGASLIHLWAFYTVLLMHIFTHLCCFLPPLCATRSADMNKNKHLYNDTQRKKKYYAGEGEAQHSCLPPGGQPLTQLHEQRQPQWCVVTVVDTYINHVDMYMRHWGSCRNQIKARNWRTHLHALQ